jgi:hypothetical protein
MNALTARRWFILTVLISALLLLACFGSTYQLSQTKKHYNQEDYAWVARQELTCRSTDDGCNQLHLLKGNACYALAKDGVTPAANYACAAAHIGEGIAQTRVWASADLSLNRPQNYTNLCAALRELQDMSAGEQAAQYTRDLLAASEAFRAAEPENVAAVYFHSGARYAQLQKQLLHPGNPSQLCGELGAILQELQSVRAEALQTPYADNVTRLIADVQGARTAVAGCR